MDTMFRCHSLNARSIVNKRIQLSALLDSEELDVLAVTETFLGEEILDSEIVNHSYSSLPVSIVSKYVVETGKEVESCS